MTIQGVRDIEIRFFPGRFLLPLAAFLLLTIGVLSSSSGADDSLFVRSQSQLERLWSGVLGCAESGDAFTIQNRFNSDGANGGTVTAGAAGDYSQCGKRALRDTGSRILVDTIEDAVRSGGVALIGERFRFDSSIGWVLDESVTGEVEALIPLVDGENPDGTGQAFFLQPGVIFWQGLESEDRIDGNFGAVYRTTFFDNFIGGGSVFYDHDFQYGHSRIGAGVDLQSGLFQGGINYYHPLNEWEEGRTDYEEQALRGVDLHVTLEREVMRLSANMSYWRFEGEEDVKEEWKPSYGLDIGIRIAPGVFLEAGYDKHDGEVSLGSRWNAGLAFRFSVPDFKGASYGEGGLSSNLWKLVEREKRILYEERLRIPRVNLSATSERVAEPTTTDGSETTVIMADLGKPLDEDVMLHVMVAETSTAILGTDFTYGYKVYELDETTGEQSAPEGDATPCPDVQEEMCMVMVPAGVTRFDIEAEVLMTDEPEAAEFIDFQVEVPEEHAPVLRGSVVERVVIEAHDNEVGFDEDAETTLAEDNEMDGIQVAISIDKPSPEPFTLNIDTGGTATEGADGNYRISTRSLAIPANASSASLTLYGIDNDMGEESKSIVLTLSGDLPTGWTIADEEHTVTLSGSERTATGEDDAGTPLVGDLGIFFTSDTPNRVVEPASGNQSVTVEVGIARAPRANITVRVVPKIGGGNDAEQGSGKDYTFTGQSVTFTPDDYTDKTFTFNIHADDVPEEDETIILELGDDSGESRTNEGSGFLLGSDHTITIPTNGKIIRFASDSAKVLNEAYGRAEVMVEVVPPAPVDITLEIRTGGQATEGNGGDYTISTTDLTIAAEESSATILLRGEDDSNNEGNETLTLQLLDRSGGLPPGYRASITPHRMVLEDDDLSAGFTTERIWLYEPGDGGSASHPVIVELTDTPDETVNLTVTPSGTAGAADYSLSTTSVSFAAGATGGDLVKLVTITVNPDDDAELDETVVLKLSDRSGSLQTGTNDFNFSRDTFTLTIPRNDNTVQFTEITGQGDLGEAAGTRTRDVRVSIADHPFTGNVDINIKRAGTATEGEDYTIAVKSPATASYADGVLRIPANEAQVDLTVTAIDDPADDWGTNETIELTLENSGGNLPLGWAIDADNSTENLTIIDNDRGIFFENVPPDGILFSHTREGAHRNSAPQASLRVSSPFPQGASFPITVEGNRDAFVLEAYGSNVSDGMINFPRNSVNVLFKMVPQQDNADIFHDVVTVTIDPDNLPPTIGTNENNVWRVEIHDDDARRIRFGVATSGATEGSSREVKLEITPPLDEDVTIPITRISGDTDAYSLSASAPASASVTTSGAVHMVNFVQSEDPSTVTLNFTAEEDEDRVDDDIVFSLNQASMPEGYSADTSSLYVRMTDNDKRVVRFSRTHASMEEGQVITADLRVSEALTENVSIPLTITGNPDAYSIIAIAPPSASYSNGRVNFIQSEDVNKVTLQFQAREDNNNVDETITVAVDERNLPPDYRIGSTQDTWEVRITDDDTRAVSFQYSNTALVSPDFGAGHVQTFEGQKENFQLRISPPLGEGQNAVIPLKVTGDRNAYWLYKVAPDGASIDQNHRVTFSQSEHASSVGLELRARRDVNHNNERIRVAVDGRNLPDGFYLGENPFVDFDILDLNETVVDMIVLEHPRAIPNDAGLLHFSAKVGDVFNVRVRSSPNWPLYICSKEYHTEYFNSHHWQSSNRSSCWPHDESFQVVPDDQPNGGAYGFVPSARDTSYVGLNKGVINRNEVNYKFTMVRAGFYKFWIRKLPYGTKAGDAWQFSVNIYN